MILLLTCNHHLGPEEEDGASPALCSSVPCMVAVPSGRSKAMSLFREMFCSGETHTSPSTGCWPSCQLCALWYRPSPGKSLTALLLGVFSARVSGAVLPWALRCTLLLPVSWLSPPFVQGECERSVPKITRAAALQGRLYPAVASKWLGKCH